MVSPQFWPCFSAPGPIREPQEAAAAAQLALAAAPQPTLPRSPASPSIITATITATAHRAADGHQVLHPLHARQPHDIARGPDGQPVPGGDAGAHRGEQPQPARSQLPACAATPLPQRLPPQLRGCCFWVPAGKAAASTLQMPVCRHRAARAPGGACQPAALSTRRALQLFPSVACPLLLPLPQVGTLAGCGGRLLSDIIRGGKLGSTPSTNEWETQSYSSRWGRGRAGEARDAEAPSELEAQAQGRC